ncbi:MAG TPA: transposase [Methylomirabilota bacterium]|nr:transposase [Methylomirabilota bacterium]
MDNAPYHSRVLDKAPTSSSTKAVIKEWLEKHNVAYDPDCRKVELLDLVKQKKPRIPKYAVDQMAREAGHRVLRLPPYHCQYNPIEMCWAWLKDYVKKRNTTFRLSDVKSLFQEAVQNLTPEMWKSYVEHTRRVVTEAWEQEGLSEKSVEQFVISIGGGDSDEESDDDLYCSDKSDKDDDSIMEYDDDLGVAPL